MSVSRRPNCITRSMKSGASSSASRVMFHSADQHSARAIGSVSAPRWSRSVANDTASKRVLAYVRSSSLTSTSSGASAPASSTTTVRAPSTSTSARSYRTRRPSSIR